MTPEVEEIRKKNHYLNAVGYLSFRGQLQESEKTPLECCAGSHVWEMSCILDKELLRLNKGNTSLVKNGQKC